MFEKIKHKIFKLTVNLSYKLIKLLERYLYFIRNKKCKHIETEYTNYQWALGHIIKNAKVCSICGELLENPFKITTDN